MGIGGDLKQAALEREAQGFVAEYSDGFFVTKELLEDTELFEDLVNTRVAKAIRQLFEQPAPVDRVFISCRMWPGRRNSQIFEEFR